MHPVHLRTSLTDIGSAGLRGPGPLRDLDDALAAATTVEQALPLLAQALQTAGAVVAAWNRRASAECCLCQVVMDVGAARDLLYIAAGPAVTLVPPLPDDPAAIPLGDAARLLGRSVRLLHRVSRGGLVHDIEPLHPDACADTTRACGYAFRAMARLRAHRDEALWLANAGAARRTGVQVFHEDCPEHRVTPADDVSDCTGEGLAPVISLDLARARRRARSGLDNDPDRAC